MFTYPMLSPGGLQLTEEYLVYTAASSSTLIVRKFDIGAGTASVVQSAAVGSVPKAICTDGTFAFATLSPKTLQQLGWNGSGWTVLTSYALAATTEALLCTPANPNRVWAIQQASFALDASMSSYNSAPTYSLALVNTTSLDAVYGRWREFVGDVRAPADDPLDKGSIIATHTATTGYRPYAFKSANNSTFSYGTSTQNMTTASAAYFAIDRDTGSMYIGKASTTIEIYTMNLSTMALTRAGTGTITATPHAIAGAKGFFIALCTDGTMRSFSLSGTTFTQVSSVTAGFSSGGNMYVSPYSGLIYTSGTGSRVHSIGNDGTLTYVGTSGLLATLTNNQTVDFSLTELPTI